MRHSEETLARFLATYRLQYSGFDQILLRLNLVVCRCRMYRLSDLECVLEQLQFTDCFLLTSLKSWLNQECAKLEQALGDKSQSSDPPQARFLLSRCRVKESGKS